MENHVKVLTFDPNFNSNNSKGGFKGSKVNAKLAATKPKKGVNVKRSPPKKMISSSNKAKPVTRPIIKKNNNANVIIQDEYEEVPNQPQLKGTNEKEDKIINTIKMISENRMKFQKTNQILREIGQIANNPVVGFLMQKDFNANPSEKLSAFISDKMLENNKEKGNSNTNIEEDPEEEYYRNLEAKIKSEIKKKKTFDFSKLSDKDRKMLAQRKLYNKMRKKNVENVPKEKPVIEENKDVDYNKVYKENKEMLRELKKENFFQDEETEKSEKREKIEEKREEKEEEAPKEKLTARQILENVLKKIEYKNEMLVNNNDNNKIKKKK